MDLYNESCSFGGPSCVANFQPVVFIPVMLIGTIDFYHFMSLSLTVTLAGVTSSAQSKTAWLHFLPYFSSDQDEN